MINNIFTTQQVLGSNALRICFSHLDMLGLINQRIKIEASLDGILIFSKQLNDLLYYLPKDSQHIEIPLRGFSKKNFETLDIKLHGTFNDSSDKPIILLAWSKECDFGIA